MWRDCGDMLDTMIRGGKRSYTRAELAEVADGLTRLLDTVRRGDLAAGPGTVSRLEGAIIALRSLAERLMVAPEDFQRWEDDGGTLPRRPICWHPAPGT